MKPANLKSKFAIEKKKTPKAEKSDEEMEDPTKESGKEDEGVEQIKSQQSIKDDGCIKVVKE